MPTLACPFCSKPMRTDNGLKWHMENIHGQAHDSSESNVPTVGSDAPDERHTPASDHCFPAYRSRNGCQGAQPASTLVCPPLKSDATKSDVSSETSYS